ncbi:MAG: MFS transporter, partial [Caldilineaceae bacterium]|nr:MFS transporter [Caldilineaceae bacterium]
MSIAADFLLIGWLTLEGTGAAIWVGAAYATYYLPMSLFGLLLGSVADSFRRDRLLLLLETVSAMLLAGLALLYWSKPIELYDVIFLAFVLGLLRAMQSTIRLSYAYDIAGPERAIAALAGVSIALRFGTVPGAIAAGLVLERYGVVVTLLAMSAAHVTALLPLVAQSQPVRVHLRKRAIVLSQLAESARELRSNPVLRTLFVMTLLIEICGISFLTLLPSVAREK